MRLVPVLKNQMDLSSGCTLKNFTKRKRLPKFDSPSNLQIFQTLFSVNFGFNGVVFFRLIRESIQLAQ